MLKALFIFEIFTFLPWLFAYVEKRLDEKAKINFKIYDVTDWTLQHTYCPISKPVKQTRQSNLVS